MHCTLYSFVTYLKRKEAHSSDHCSVSVFPRRTRFREALSCNVRRLYIQSNEIHNVVALIKFFISTQVSALHVSDRNGPSSGASL